MSTPIRTLRPSPPRATRRIAGLSGLALAVMLPGLALAQVSSDPVGWWGRSAPRDDGRRLEAGDDAARLYAGARADLDAQQAQAAQRKLEVLVARYPTSPLADVARRDLQRLYSATAAPVPAVSPALITGAPLTSTAARPSPLPQRSLEPRATPNVDAVPSPPPAIQVDARLQAATDDFRHRAGDRIFFADQSDDIGPRAHIALQAQADWLSRHPTVTVLIEGHADEFGGTEINQKIALERAQAVKLRLLDLGIDPARVSVKGYGRDQPIADCAQKTCAEQNRRVVTRITSAPIGVGSGVAGIGSRQ